MCGVFLEGWRGWAGIPWSDVRDQAKDTGSDRDRRVDERRGSGYRAEGFESYTNFIVLSFLVRAVCLLHFCRQMDGSIDCV